MTSHSVYRSARSRSQSSIPQCFRLAMLALMIGASLSASASGAAAELRQPMSEAEVIAFGEEPKSGAYYQLPTDPTLVNADQHQPKGGSSTFYTSIAASEFRPRSSASDFYIPYSTTLACRPTGTNSLAEAQLQLPQGAQFQFLRIYAGDVNENDLNVALVERCQPIAAAGNVTTTVLGSVLTSGTPGQLTQSIGIPGAQTVDNVQCTYSLRVQLNSTVNGCAPGLQLDKARVQWIQ